MFVERMNLDYYKWRTIKEYFINSLLKLSFVNGGEKGGFIVNINNFFFAFLLRTF